MKLGILVSGDLGNTVLRELNTEKEISFVCTDKRSLHIIQFCRDNNIPFYAGNPRNGKALHTLPKAHCDILVSVNYLFIIEKDLIQLPRKLGVNFHGSLLPKYRGRTPHVWAIINGEKETGITAHVIDDHCDTGPILAQKTFAISSTDTGGSILEKFKKEYPRFVKAVLKTIADGTYTARAQDPAHASHCGKRGPEDGKIDWNWPRERIFNWVRAQTRPYPGAFSMLEGKKLKIFTIEFDETPYRVNDPNGLILAIESGKPIIKTHNGCIKILDHEHETDLKTSLILS